MSANNKQEWIEDTMPDGLKVRHPRYIQVTGVYIDSVTGYIVDADEMKAIKNN